MSKLYFDARTEGAPIRPFTGADQAAQVSGETVVVSVTSSLGTKDIQSKGAMEIGIGDFSALGVKILIKDMDALGKAIDPLVVDLDDVSVAVVVADRRTGVLRESFVVFESQFKELPSELTIQEAGTRNNLRPLGNRKTGFTVEFVAFHNKDKPSTASTKPRVRGAILVKNTYEVRPVTAGDSLQPVPLTDEVREANGLAKNVWSYFKAKSGLLTAGSFDEAATFYVDPEVLNSALYGEAVAGAVLESLIYSQAIAQLVYEFSAQLRLHQEDNETLSDVFAESQVFKFFRNNFADRDDLSLAAFLIDEPQRVVSAILSSTKQRKKLFTAIENMGGGSNGLSDSEGE
jgi:hypothetical protein